ncbi:hypothetical protein AbHV_ORF14 [Abalone herpesvirus Victoria/AUS/2009]|uniref:Uncharacterized protein n=2 Tax=Herpesvirales TaxID=548681 RepID=K4JUE1_ABHV|nr:hypothetical protein AbHV_ORF14 [Abalone herpesvirus Victoria/AUS/2009]AFU90024.1 hypothetical protein AbHV_ORF14 [Abalone herpesvirus Victoria/AUS/2009]AMW36211.1 hypothetical protein tc2005_p067c [Abalone herpesvirus Taiwan/2005]UCX57003.1 ORF13 [Haliotid herpesvirus 1]
MTSYLNRLNASPNKEHIDNFAGTFVPTGAVQNIRVSSLTDAVAIANTTNTSFISGINVNFMNTLVNLHHRAPQLVTATEGLIQTARDGVPVVQTGPNPIEAGKTITVIPPITDQSGTYVYTVGATEGLVYVPETVEIVHFAEEFNQFLSSFFLFQELAEKIQNEDAFEDLIKIIGDIKLNNNSIWMRLMAAVQTNLPGMIDDAAAAREVMRVVEIYWLPVIDENHLYDTDTSVIDSIKNLAEKFANIKFGDIKQSYVNGAAREVSFQALLQAVNFADQLANKIKRIGDQLKKFTPYPVGTIIKSPGTKIYRKQEMIIALTQA